MTTTYKTIAILLITTALLAGCSRKEAEVPEYTVALQIAGPVQGPVAVKVADEPAVGHALTHIAATADLSKGIPAANYREFFNAVAPAEGFAEQQAEAGGEIALKGLRSQYFIIALAGDSLWVVNPSDTRDGKLQLSAENAGGERALKVAAARPGLKNQLTAAAQRALGDKEFLRARNLATVTGATELLTEINNAEAGDLVAQAEKAIAAKDYDTAQQLANRAQTLAPDSKPAQELARKIMEEKGGELRAFTGHTGEVLTVAVSADGALALSGGSDRLVKVWDLAAGKELRTLTGHRAAVKSVAVARDGKIAVSASADGSMILWDVESGEKLHVSDGLGWSINSVAFLPDGSSLVSGGDDNQIKLWTVPSFQLVRSFGGHGWKVISVAVSRDGRMLLSGSADDSMKLWDIASGREVRSFRNDLSDVNGVAFSPDSPFGLSGGADHSVKLWNLSNGREVTVLAGHTKPVRAVAFLGNDNFAVSGGEDATLRIWDLGTGKVVRTFENHSAAVTGLAVLPDGRQLLTAGGDGTVRLWQLPRDAWPPEPSER